MRSLTPQDINTIQAVAYRMAGWKPTGRTAQVISSIVRSPRGFTDILLHEQLLLLVRICDLGMDGARRSWQHGEHDFAQILGTTTERIRNAVGAIEGRRYARDTSYTPPLPPEPEPLQPHRLLLFRSARSQQRSDY